MADQPRYEPYEASTLFADSLAMRRPIAGTVPRDEARYRAFRSAVPAGPLAVDSTGADSVAGGSHSTSYPIRLTEEVLQRGRQQFDIYCSPCHGRAGYGDGIIVQRGLRPPPSFHTARLRAAPPGHFYDVIANGFGAMYSYASSVSPADRWAIAAYIRALQLSQNADTAWVASDTLARSRLR